MKRRFREKASLLDLVLESPRATIVAGGVASALLTFTPAILTLYFGYSAESASKLFALLYLFLLPILVSAAYTLHKLGNVLVEACGAERFPAVSYFVSVLPLGYVPALQALLMQLTACTRGRLGLRITVADLVWNLLTFGAYALPYSAMVSKVLDLVVYMLREEKQ